MGITKWHTSDAPGLDEAKEAERNLWSNNPLF